MRQLIISKIHETDIIIWTALELDGCDYLAVLHLKRVDPIGESDCQF